MHDVGAAAGREQCNRNGIPYSVSWGGYIVYNSRNRAVCFAVAVSNTLWEGGTMLLSLIVPCYNEQDAIPIFYKEVKKVLEDIPVDYELLFINDGSKDDTLKILHELSRKDSHVYYISFSRNFGKEAAMYAGFCNVQGDYTAVMDVDLQDPPAMLPQMLEIIQTGEYDSAAARRTTRKGEPRVRSWFARRFYQMINRISDADIVDGARGEDEAGEKNK